MTAIVIAALTGALIGLIAGLLGISMINRYVNSLIRDAVDRLEFDLIDRTEDYYKDKEDNEKTQRELNEEWLEWERENTQNNVDGEYDLLGEKRFNPDDIQGVFDDIFKPTKTEPDDKK